MSKSIIVLTFRVKRHMEPNIMGSILLKTPYHAFTHVVTTLAVVALGFRKRELPYLKTLPHCWYHHYRAYLCERVDESRKNKQVYLGVYDDPEKAARAYDRAALRYWGPQATLNFPAKDYSDDMIQMQTMTKQEYIASLIRNSSGFAKGASKYRGVSRRHSKTGGWQARIKKCAGYKDIYLGTFVSEEEAATAYDIVAIKFRGFKAVTNFPIHNYDIQEILASDCFAMDKLPLDSSTNAIANDNIHEMASSTLANDILSSR